MGCGNPREKVENEMIKMKMQRTVIQMERNNQLKLLRDIDGKELKFQKIPDYIDESMCTNQDVKKKIKKTEPGSVKKRIRLRKSKTCNPKKRKKTKEEPFETLKGGKHLRRKKTCKV